MISEVAPAGTAAGRPASHTIEASGALALPALAEPHAHLDKALTAGRIANPTDDLAGAIVAWIEARPSMTIGDTADRALRAAHELVANGAGGHPHPRRHRPRHRGRRRRGAGVGASTSWTPSWSCSSWCARRFRSPAPRVPTTLRSLATRSKPDVPSPSAVRRTSTNARARRSICSPISPPNAGLGLDLHVDETLDATVFTLPHIVALAERGFPGSIVAGHCVSLGVQPTDVQRRVSEQLAAAGDLRRHAAADQPLPAGPRPVGADAARAAPLAGAPRRRRQRGRRRRQRS